MLKLMYITNNDQVAQIAEKYGVDRIFVDLEHIGKEERQKGMDTVKSKHKISDIKNIKRCLNKSELLVRVNPIHTNSKNEILEVIENGADIVMLPYFKTVNEVKQFLNVVDRKSKTCLLLETPEAVNVIDEILELEGIDEIHIGLNDLHLGYGMKFMFELLTNGMVEMLCNKFKLKGLRYGFGGIASLGKGMIPAEMIIKEHYKLGSSMVILSRSFCNVGKVNSIDEVEAIFSEEVKKIRELENEAKEHIEYFNKNNDKINQIISSLIV